MIRRSLMAPTSIATSGKTSWMLNTNGAPCAFAAAHPAGPSVSGGDMASTTSGRLRVSRAVAPFSAVKAPKARARAGMFVLSVGNGCTRLIRPQARSSCWTSPSGPVGRHSGSTRWCSYQGRDVTTCSWWPRAASSWTMLVITTPVGREVGLEVRAQHRDPHAALPSASRHVETSASTGSSQVSSAARLRPASASRRRLSGSTSRVRIVRVHPPTSSGSRRRPASPTTSGSARARRGDDGRPEHHRLGGGGPEALEGGRDRHRGAPAMSASRSARGMRPVRRTRASTPSRRDLGPHLVLALGGRAGEHERDVGILGRQRSERPHQREVVLVAPRHGRVHEPGRARARSGARTRSISSAATGGCGSMPWRTTRIRSTRDPEPLVHVVGRVLAHRDDEPGVAHGVREHPGQPPALDRVERVGMVQRLEVVDRHDGRHAAHERAPSRRGGGRRSRPRRRLCAASQVASASTRPGRPPPVGASTTSKPAAEARVGLEGGTAGEHGHLHLRCRRPGWRGAVWRTPRSRRPDPGRARAG